MQQLTFQLISYAVIYAGIIFAYDAISILLTIFMKLYIFLLTFIALAVAGDVKSQNLHLNLFAGTSNYSGDLQDKEFTFSQSNFAGGVGLSYDLSDHFSVRSGVTFGSLSANDKYGRNSLRNLNFSSKLTEVNLGLSITLHRFQLICLHLMFLQASVFIILIPTLMILWAGKPISDL